MQDPSSFADALHQQLMMKPLQQPQFPEQEQLKCPRCDSSNTKFCYYNNYNLSQPRHFCKACRRYWTKGGALRNIPIGGASRKNAKRSSSSSSSSSAAASKRSSSSSPSDPSPPATGPSPSGPKPEGPGQVRVEGAGTTVGSFSSLLVSNGQFGNLLEGIGHGPGSGNGMGRGPMPAGRGAAEGFPVGLQSGGESGCWGGGGNNNNNNGWPDLAIFTPGSRFQ